LCVALLAVLLLPVTGLAVATRRRVGIGWGVIGAGANLSGSRLTSTGWSVAFGRLSGLSGARPDPLAAIARIVLLRLTTRLTDSSMIDVLSDSGLSDSGLAISGLSVTKLVGLLAVPRLAVAGLSSPGLSSPGLRRPGLRRPGLRRPGLRRPGLSSPGLAVSGIGGLLTEALRGLAISALPRLLSESGLLPVVLLLSVTRLLSVVLLPGLAISAQPGLLPIARLPEGLLPRLLAVPRLPGTGLVVSRLAESLRRLLTRYRLLRLLAIAVIGLFIRARVRRCAKPDCRQATHSGLSRARPSLSLITLLPVLGLPVLGLPILGLAVLRLPVPGLSMPSLPVVSLPVISLTGRLPVPLLPVPLLAVSLLPVSLFSVSLLPRTRLVIFGLLERRPPVSRRSRRVRRVRRGLTNLPPEFLLPVARLRLPVARLWRRISRFLLPVPLLPVPGPLLPVASLCWLSITALAITRLLVTALPLPLARTPTLTRTLPLARPRTLILAVPALTEHRQPKRIALNHASRLIAPNPLRSRRHPASRHPASRHPARRLNHRSLPGLLAMHRRGGLSVFWLVRPRLPTRPRAITFLLRLVLVSVVGRCFTHS